MAEIRVEPARWGYVRRGRRNWKVIDNSGPKVFTRVFVYSHFAAAVTNAHRIARREPISTFGLLSVHTEHHPAHPGGER